MKIENQCCSLEQAKRLKELGVEQKSFFWWNKTNSQKDGEHKFIEAADAHDYTIRWKKPEQYGSDWQMFSAFSGSELGAITDFEFSTWRNGQNKWVISRHDAFDKWMYGDTEAECRANLLIHLLENNLITSEEVNKRLANS